MGKKAYKCNPSGYNQQRLYNYPAKIDDDSQEMDRLKVLSTIITVTEMIES